MGVDLACLNCIHYVESRQECHGWDRPAPVNDPVAAASRCRRYTDIYGREVEWVEGKARFKPAGDTLGCAKQVVDTAAVAQRAVEAVSQDVQAAQARDMLKAVGGSVPCLCRVHPVGMRVVRDAAPR